MTDIRRIGLTAASIMISGGLLIPTQAVIAQSLEEVVVTARKIEENILEVPLAITAFTSEDIEARDFVQLEDIQKFSPGFSFTAMQGGSARNDRGTNELRFRGLNLGFNSGVYAAGVTFINGAPVLGGYNPSMADVERIEILKGPQSAYFGRSTFAGAINYVTKNPSDEFGGNVSVGYEEFGSHNINFSIEGPIGETLAGRISFRDWEQGGYYDNGTDGTKDLLGERTTQSIAGSLVWTPTEKLTVNAFVNFFEDEDGPGAQFALKDESYNGRGDPSGRCVGINDPLPMIADPTAPGGMRQATYRDRFAGGMVCGELPGVNTLDPSIISVDPTLDPATAESIFNPPPQFTVFDPSFSTNPGLYREATQATLRIDYDFDNGITFSSLSAYHDNKQQNIIDLNYRDFRDRSTVVDAPDCQFVLCQFGFFQNPFTFCLIRTGFDASKCNTSWKNTLNVHGQDEDWSQEFRLTSPQDRRFRWSAGINIFDAFQPGSAVYGQLFIGPFFTSAVTQRDAETIGLFGGIAYDITDDLTLTIEARLQEDEITETTLVDTTGAAIVPPIVFNETFDSFTPRVSLDWQYSDDAMMYFLYATGSRPGRFNTAFETSEPEVIEALRQICPSCGTVVDESELINWELGWKGSFWDGRATATAAVYYMQWRDGQVPNTIPVSTGTTANLVSVTVNNGDTDLTGIELEASFAATDNLTLSGSLGISDTEINDFDCTFCEQLTGSRTIATGNRMPNAPKLAWSLSAMYENQLTVADSRWDWYGRMDWSYEGSKYMTSANLTKTAPINDVALRLGMRNDNWSFEAYVLNALDHDEMIGAFHGIDLYTFFGFYGGSSGGRNEVRFGAPVPRRFGIRASYSF